MRLEDAVNFMENFVDQINTCDIRQTANYRCIAVFRDGLVDAGFTEDEANLIAGLFKINVAQIYLDEYEDRIFNQLKDLAKGVFRIYEVFDDDFGPVDVETFMKTMGADMSYTLEA